MERSYERDAAEPDLGASLQRWAEEGWLAQGAPLEVGRTAGGQQILRVRLVRTLLAQRPPHEPPLVLRPPWRLGESDDAAHPSA